MKKTTILKSLVLLFCISIYNTSTAQETKTKKTTRNDIRPENINPENGLVRCAFTEYEEILRANDPKRKTQEEFEAWIAPLIQKQKEMQQVSSESGGIIYIPVVVHVIHNGDAYGVNENIRDEQVQSQITVMTQDFRRMAGTPGFNNNAIGADTQVEFVLAKVDPNGNPTNGIDRVNLCRDNYNAGSFSAIQSLIDTEVKPQTIWDPNLYMNMWSVNWDGSGLLGYAQFPSTSGLSGLNSSGGGALTDGVVAGHSYFGSRTLYPAGNYGDTTYDKGRTMTHEVGHFLGLLHTFQGGCANTNTNTNGDYCSDTPSISAANYGCVANTNSCAAPGLDMIENYMDYTDDSCMNIYTIEQKTRITTVMNNSIRRVGLKTSTKDIAIPLFANDAEVKIENSCDASTAPTCANPNPGGTNKVISLYNRGTANLTSATLSYSIGGPTLTQNWTGNLAPNKFAYVTLSNTTANGTLNVSITAANGGTDQRASNNSASKTFTSGSSGSIPNHNFTTYTFNLIGDRYGAETSWNLKNASGTTLYSGGPYTNLSANGTQNLVTNQTWTLPANGCYTFTINDSYGDGICCNYGAGSYTITTNTGATVVATGGTFASTESKAFTNNTLANSTFNSFNDMYVYPNPTKSIINVAIPNTVELPTSLIVYNNIGQLIESKKVTSVDDLSVNTTLYSNGIYFITVSNETENKTLQFIKE
jgi:hypothetical protein